jgi:CheY-like chemotaxis protein
MGRQQQPALSLLGPLAAGTFRKLLIQSFKSETDRRCRAHAPCARNWGFNRGNKGFRFQVSGFRLPSTERRVSRGKSSKDSPLDTRLSPLFLSLVPRHSPLDPHIAPKYNSGRLFFFAKFLRGSLRIDVRDREEFNAALMPGPHQSIVVVEDDAGMKKAIERLLRAAGFHPVSFASAEELLQTEAAESAACLVLDIHLPGLSGLELGRLLVTSGRPKPLIFITGQDEASLRDEAQRLGCGYFRKPFEGKALLEAIRWAIGVDSK